MEQGRDAGPDTGSATSVADDAYRGFLFADLRGYTAFAERHGDAAAADLIDAYRVLVRDVIGRHAGAEIRTEGDSFYVVFGSARRAVACALAILDAAAGAIRDMPDRPIRVGIGINAGETVQRGEGFVGTAVNLAARVCAQAREGEVLVTAAVRDALGSTPDLKLVSRGTRRLKGIARPVPLFAVQRGASSDQPATPLVRVRSLPIMAVIVVLVVSVGLGAVASGLRQRTTDSSPTPVAGELASATAPSTVSPTPLADPSAYPNTGEAELIAIVGEEIEPHCGRADEDDRPIIVLAASEVETFGVTQEDRKVAHIGIECVIPGASAPDSFRLWMTRPLGPFSAVDTAESLVLNRSGRDGIPRGDCSDGGQALEGWEFGAISGWLLCRDVSGDAVIEWSYDGHPLYGRAARRDGDLAALVSWWTAEARLMAP